MRPRSTPFCFGLEETGLRYLFLGIAGLFATGNMASRLGLALTGWILQAAGFAAALFLVTVFHTELRHIMMRTEGWLRRGASPREEIRHLETIAETAFALSQARVGALIVLVRDHSIEALSMRGEEVSSAISPGLLQAIFQRDSPLHDGAVVIEGRKLRRAGVLLPLSDRTDVPGCFGTRHRAALGICERCDAVAVVVSEQRGNVTFVSGAEWRHPGTAGELKELLRAGKAVAQKSLSILARNLLFANTRLKLASAGIAAVFWMSSFVSVETTIRDLSVPVEFTNVPSGLDIARPSARELEVRVRGPRWVVESLRPGQVSARFDLSGARPGTQVLSRAGEVANLPAGVVVERVTPPDIVVSVVPAGLARAR